MFFIGLKNIKVISYKFTRYFFVNFKAFKTIKIELNRIMFNIHTTKLWFIKVPLCIYTQIYTISFGPKTIRV